MKRSAFFYTLPNYVRCKNAYTYARFCDNAPSARKNKEIPPLYCYVPPYRIVVACEVEKFPVAETKISAHDYPEYSPQGLAAG